MDSEPAPSSDDLQLYISFPTEDRSATACHPGQILQTDLRSILLNSFSFNPFPSSHSPPVPLTTGHLLLMEPEQLAYSFPGCHSSCT